MQEPSSDGQATRLSDLTPQQWKSGAAAWLGWLFDGLDMHLYTLVALPFVAELLDLPETRKEVRDCGSWIMAAFLIGWALGGAFFGIVGDRIGRSRTLMLTILTYALFTGLSYFAQTWWQLLIFRFVAALGIGGEWAVGASLLSETWPQRWRPWLAAVLQTGVNCGTMLALLTVYCLAGLSSSRFVFLVGVLPAFLVLWIRRAVPETAEWQEARGRSRAAAPRFLDLFRGPTRRTALLTLTVCSLSLTAHWAFQFWNYAQLRQLSALEELTQAERTRLFTVGPAILICFSIMGNFIAALLALKVGYRRAIAILCVGYFAMMYGAYGVPRRHDELYPWLAGIGACHGIFALFTMYLPPLFPTLLRTTGAGFCYNFGRIAAGLGTVLFGLFAEVGDYRLALFYAGFLFLPAAAIAWLMPDT